MAEFEPQHDKKMEIVPISTGAELLDINGVGKRNNPWEQEKSTALALREENRIAELRKGLQESAYGRENVGGWRVVDQPEQHPQLTGPVTDNEPLDGVWREIQEEMANGGDVDWKKWGKRLGIGAGGVVGAAGVGILGFFAISIKEFIGAAVQGMKEWNR